MGTIYLDDGGRLLGSLQYGPSHLFPRAADLPAGPVSDDAVLVTCSYLKGDGAEWVEKSLLPAAIGESRDRGAVAMEAFACNYPDGESIEEWFLVHRTVFPRDFLEEFGFETVRRKAASIFVGSSSPGSCRSKRGAARVSCALSGRRSRLRRGHLYHGRDVVADQAASDRKRSLTARARRRRP